MGDMKQTESPHKWQRWKHVILTAEALDELAERKDADLQKIMIELSSIEEVFPKTVDPVDDLEGFAVRRLCRALKSAIHSSIQGKGD